MPSDVMDLQGLSPSSFFSEDSCFAGERQVGFWKSDTSSGHYATRKLVPSSPFEKLIPVESPPLKPQQHRGSYEMQDRKVNFSMQRRAVGAERVSAQALTSLSPMKRDPMEPSLYIEQGKSKMNGVQYENNLFSSSLSELFSKKLSLPSTTNLYGSSVETFVPHCVEEEPFESLEEIEAQTIGNLLPNDDDLFSGVTDELDYIVQHNGRDDMEELDIFSSVGGMDLGEDGSYAGKSTLGIRGGVSPGQLGVCNGSVVGEHPYGEHPSRTLFVRNINSNVEDSELHILFKKYGDIRTLYTACKHRGFVMISYYDIRAARNAMKALQSRPLRRRKLDIHYSIPKDNPSEKDINQGTLVVFNLDSSVSNDELKQIFGVYGEIKEIRTTPDISSHKFIEFYDVRAAEAALRALNMSDIAGKQIKLEPSHPGGAKWSNSQQFPPEMEQDECVPYLQQNSPPNPSTTGFTGVMPHGVITSNSLDNGTIFGMHSTTRASTSPFLEMAFHHGISSTVLPNSSPSLMKAESFGSQSFFAEPAHSQRPVKIDILGTPSSYPHSLPEYHDCLTTGNSPHNMTADVRTRSVGRFCRVGSKENTGELSEAVFGSSNNEKCPPPGLHYTWNNSYSPQPPGMVWSESPSRVNGISTAHPPSQLHGLPRMPSHVNTFLPSHTHHVGSAPTVDNRPLWNRPHCFAGESPEASGFHPGSLGNMMISNHSPHSMEFVSHNIYPRVGGSCLDMPMLPQNIGIQPQNVMFPGREMISMLNSYYPPNERARGRRNGGNFGQADNKKQFELDVDRIKQGEDNRTTLMIKNIPNKYTSKMLLAAIDECHRGTYDFIYLPIDFKNKCNVGYAFINMTQPSLIIPFYQAFEGKKWEKFNSEKVASIAYARIQGKSALIAHFQNSSLMNEDKRCRPILFNTDGPNAGDQVSFPMGVNIRSRPGKPQTNTTNGDYQGSPPNFLNGEVSSNGDSSSCSGKELD